MTDEAPATPAVNGDAAPAPVVQTPTAPVADAAPDPAKAEPVKKKPDYRQQKIADLSYQNRELERRLDKLLGATEALAKGQNRTEEQPPNPEDFKTLGEYIRAEIAYNQKQNVKPEKSEDDGKKAEYERAVDTARSELMTAGSEKYDDFADLLSSPSLRITATMRDAIFEVEEQDSQVEMSYYLAQNPKEALRISKLSPMRQVQEIGKLEAKITSAPPPKRPSSAPAPIAPVGGVNTPSDTIQDVEDYPTFLKKRNKELGRT